MDIVNWVILNIERPILIANEVNMHEGDNNANMDHPIKQNVNVPLSEKFVSTYIEKIESSDNKKKNCKRIEI